MTILSFRAARQALGCALCLQAFTQGFAVQLELQKGSAY